ncbi:hypothetical protein PABG_11516 [Paracoccidioides brasiliensis Pb03]|nr:hypothetical protein PABG_11516 [Paracoccidioides brasiliensis Pb03]
MSESPWLNSVKLWKPPAWLPCHGMHRAGSDWLIEFEVLIHDVGENVHRPCRNVCLVYTKNPWRRKRGKAPGVFHVTGKALHIGANVSVNLFHPRGQQHVARSRKVSENELGTHGRFLSQKKWVSDYGAQYP